MYFFTHPVIVEAMDIKQWLSENAHRRITDQDIADILGVTRKTANKRINDGITSDDLIALCAGLGINRTSALVELDKLPYQDVLEFLDSDGQLVETAEDGQLALELARRLNPATMARELDELAARRAMSGTSDSIEDDGTVRDFDYDIPHAADSSIDEDAERESRGEDLID